MALSIYSLYICNIKMISFINYSISNKKSYIYGEQGISV